MVISLTHTYTPFSKKNEIRLYTLFLLAEQCIMSKFYVHEQTQNVFLKYHNNNYFLQNFWLKDFEDGSSFFAFLNHWDKYSFIQIFVIFLFILKISAKAPHLRTMGNTFWRKVSGNPVPDWLNRRTSLATINPRLLP